MVKEARVEKFLLLPFSFGCDSESSVAVSNSSECSRSREKGRALCRIKKVNKYKGFWKASFSQTFHRLINGFRNFSQFFVQKDEVEQEEREMEIGFPTDVKHLAHIGIEAIRPSETAPFPSVSLQQFEASMAAQSRGASNNVT